MWLFRICWFILQLHIRNFSTGLKVCIDCTNFTNTMYRLGLVESKSYKDKSAWPNFLDRILPWHLCLLLNPFATKIVLVGCVSWPLGYYSNNNTGISSRNLLEWLYLRLHKRFWPYIVCSTYIHSKSDLDILALGVNIHEKTRWREERQTHVYHMNDA